MKLELKKFGTTLISRQAGKEALASFQPTLGEIGADDNLELDFDGVVTFSPSWGMSFWCRFSINWAIDWFYCRRIIHP